MLIVRTCFLTRVRRESLISTERSRLATVSGYRVGAHRETIIARISVVHTGMREVRMFLQRVPR